MASLSCFVSDQEFKAFHRIDRELYTILVINLWRDTIESMQILALWLCRVRAMEGIMKITNEVCMRAVSDIMQQAILRNSSQTIVGNQMTMPVSTNQLLGHSDGLSGVRLGCGVGQNLTPQIEVPADDRTMFVTFSKGYPVYEWEVRDFLGRTYGDCVESLYMQEVQTNEQSLFARIVFHKASTIDGILRGRTKAKFTINGKHVWARKFLPKRTKSSVLQQMPPQSEADSPGSAGS
ncbi:Rho guanine nucleotide exchange factor [Quillaja saponaria]|uniref:Rho guanine nucleotide exchange factor n=1 Tax=Quillaja saponaria TaxID=32244 RepID=A0AAD7QCY8_QUISA|nr:Rho guanine nucleotide exchange factor [Quillaja saponaria]